jgi:O-antigen ligase
VLPVLLGLTAAFVGVSAANERWGLVAIVLGAIAAGGIAAFLLSRPEAALRAAFFLILVSTTKFRERSPGALLAVAVNLLPAFRRRPVLRLTRNEMLLGAYVLLAMTSVLWSENVHVSAGRAAQLGLLYIMCAVAVRRLGPPSTLRTLAASVVTYVVLAIGMAAFFPGARHEGDLFSWFAVHPIDAGTFAGSAAMIMIASAVYTGDAWRRPLKRLALWAGIITCIVVLLAAHERTPIFAFMAGASALWMRKYLRPWAAGLTLCAMLALSALGLRTLADSYGGAAAAPDFANPIALYILRGQSGEEFLGLSGRMDLWDYESSMIRERPLFGHGYVASRSMMLERFPWAGTSHGALPEIALNLGLAGAALLGMVLLRTLVLAFTRMRPRGPGAWGEALVLGSLVFLIVLAVANDSFAGAPGYEVLVFLAVTMAHPHLRSGAVEDPAAA